LRLLFQPFLVNKTQRNEQRRGKIVGKVQLVGFVVHVIHAKKNPEILTREMAIALLPPTGRCCTLRLWLCNSFVDLRLSDNTTMWHRDELYRAIGISHHSAFSNERTLEKISLMAGQNCVVVVIPSDEALEVEERLVSNDLPEAIANIVIQPNGNDSDPLDVISTILVREPVRVYVYHYPAAARQTQARPNIRATRFAMACGHFAMRFKGTVVLTVERTSGVNDHHLALLSSVMAATQNCDLRPHCLGDDHGDLPDWLLGACRNTYHDAAALQKLADVMVSDTTSDCEPPSDNDNADVDVDVDDDDPGSRGQPERDADEEPREAVTTAVPLCLWCRRPSSRLCARCHGVYFCNTECEANGYVHTKYRNMARHDVHNPERSDSMSSQGGHTNVCVTTTGDTRNGVLFCQIPVLANGPAT
jgi:hypothetical protein